MSGQGGGGSVTLSFGPSCKVWCTIFFSGLAGHFCQVWRKPRHENVTVPKVDHIFWPFATGTDSFELELLFQKLSRSWHGSSSRSLRSRAQKPNGAPVLRVYSSSKFSVPLPHTCSLLRYTTYEQNNVLYGIINQPHHLSMSGTRLRTSTFPNIF